MAEKFTKSVSLFGNILLITKRLTQRRIS